MLEYAANQMRMVQYNNECFRWCHLAKVYSDKVKSNRERISHYKKYVDTLNYDGIEFPISIKQIPKIEDQNNISINVIGYENKNRFPLYVSQKVTETILDLLLIWEEEKQHYVWIKDFNRFMFSRNRHRHRLLYISVDTAFNFLGVKKFLAITHQTALLLMESKSYECLK